MTTPTGPGVNTTDQPYTSLFWAVSGDEATAGSANGTVSHLADRTQGNTIAYLGQWFKTTSIWRTLPSLEIAQLKACFTDLIAALDGLDWLTPAGVVAGIKAVIAFINDVVAWAQHVVQNFTGVIPPTWRVNVRAVFEIDMLKSAWNTMVAAFDAINWTIWDTAPDLMAAWSAVLGFLQSFVQWGRKVFQNVTGLDLFNGFAAFAFPQLRIAIRTFRNALQAINWSNPAAATAAAVAAITALSQAVGNWALQVLKNLVAVIETGPIHDAFSSPQNFLDAFGLSGLVSGIETVANNIVDAVVNTFLGQGGTGFHLSDFVRAIKSIPGQLITGSFSPAQVTHLNIGSLSGFIPELLVNPNFDISDSILGQGIWTWDGTQGPSGVATSIYADASGVLKELYSNAIAVGQGMVFNISGNAQWSGFTGAANSIALTVAKFDNNATLLGYDVIGAVASPGSSGTWTALSSAYTVPSGVATIVVRPIIAASATTGRVWFGKLSVKQTATSLLASLVPLLDASKIGTGQFAQSFVTNLVSDLSAKALQADFQSVVDQAYQAAFGGSSTNNPISTFFASLTQIPNQNVIGVLGPNQIGQAITAAVDSIFQGWTGSGAIGVSLGQLSYQAGQIASNLLHSLNIGTANSSQIANRAVTKPSFGAVDPTADAVFNLSQISGATSTFVGVTAATSIIGYITTPDAGLKKSVMWLGQTTTNITGMWLNLYSVNTATGAMTWLCSSPNLMLTQTPSNVLAWNYWNIPASAQITSVQGNVYAVEMMVTGTGTYQVAGIPGHWLPGNTNVFPPSMAASRATSGPTTPSYSAIGTAQNGSSATSFNVAIPITIPTAATALVIPVSYIANTISNPINFTVSIGGNTFPSQVLANPNQNISGSNYGLALLGVLLPPTGGPQTVTVNISWDGTQTVSCQANALSYNGCSGFGTPQSATATAVTGTTVTQTVTSGQTGQTIFQVFADAHGITLTGYTQTQRWSQAFLSGRSGAIVAGDAAGAASVAFAATASANDNWACAAVPLLQAAAPLSIPSPTYSNNVPWFGLGGSAGVTQYPPATTPFNTPGTTTYAVPVWMVAGSKFDIAVLGAGGAGGSWISGINGAGGAAGVWATRATLVYGTDIPLSVTSFSVTVGTGGVGGAGNGGPGVASSVSISGYGTITGTGGGGGGQGGGTSQANLNGKSPGNQTVNGTPYYGGGVQTVGGDNGNAPGGGAAGGVFGGGGGPNGAPGEVWITAYQ